MAGSKTILFVEDDRPISEMYARVLTRNGYRVDFAYDGSEGLQKAQAKHFDLILLDPPTFSRSKEHGVFQAEKDYGKLVTAALPLLRPGGVLFASTNAAQLAPEVFLETVEAAVTRAKRTILQRHYAPQPPDFPISRAEPGYMKTLWLRLS